MARKKDIYNAARTCVHTIQVSERGTVFTKPTCPNCRKIKNPRIKDFVYIVMAEKCNECKDYKAIEIKRKVRKANDKAKRI